MVISEHINAEEGFIGGGDKIDDIKRDSVQQKVKLTFDYKRTDGLYKFSEPTTGDFDVFIHARKQAINGIYLVRHDKTNPGMYDKYLYISMGTGWNKIYSKMVIPGYDRDGTESGTYIFPVGQNNGDSYNEVNRLIIVQQTSEV